MKNQRATIKSAENDPYTGSPWAVIKEQLRLASYLERIHSTRSVREKLRVYEQVMPMSPDPYRTCTLNAVLMTRLDEDQEAYTFLKSWVLYVEARPGNKKPPVSHAKDADVFEPVDLFLGICDARRGKSEALGFLVTLTSIKIKLLLDLRAVDVAIRSLGPQFSQDVLDLILERVPQSPAVATNRAIMNGQGLSAEISKLEAQVDALYNKVHETNAFFWPMMAYKTRDDIMVGRAEPACGSVEEAQLLFLGQDYSWGEIPGARDLIKKKVDARQ